MKYYLIVVWFCFTLNSIAAQVPTWAVNANEFQYNMSVTAEIALDFVTNHEEDNLIGAFVNEELRGVASPIIVNDSAIYFLTIYSNVTGEEEVSFQVYLQAGDSILHAVERLPFENNQIVGEVHNPFTLNISRLGDFPISLLPFLTDTTLAGYAFDPIFVTDHLVQLDNDSILWTVISSEHLSATIVNNEFLLVTSNSTEWTGSESISIIASETGNSQMFADTQDILLTVLPDFTGPIFDYIPIQLADVNNEFSLTDLNGYIEHDGSCLDYKMEMNPLSGDEPSPIWSPPPIIGGSMNLVLQMSFNDSSFHDTGIIAGFIDGQLAGIGDPIFASGVAYYFLTLSEVSSGNISFQFYDSERKFLYSIPTLFDFMAGGSIGSVSKPEVIDLSPIKITMGSQGEVSATLIDTSFEHTQTVKFKIADCFYPIKNDSMTVLFSKSQCSLADVEICPGEAVCARSSSDLINTVWFKNNVPIWSDSILSINEPGEYFFQGTTIENNMKISCLLKVSEGNGCVGDFPINNYPDVEIDFAGGNGEVAFEPFAADEISFEITWNGNGDHTTWHDSFNWDLGEVPCPCQHVVIPSNENVIIESNTSSRIWSLETQTNAILTLQLNALLKVIGIK